MLPMVKQPHQQKRRRPVVSLVKIACYVTIGTVVVNPSLGFAPSSNVSSRSRIFPRSYRQQALAAESSGQERPSARENSGGINMFDHFRKMASGFAMAGLLAASLSFSSPAFAENELSAKYGGGLDTSLVDQTCFVDKCSAQAKACLADDPNCRKGLTCTAKCLGDNSCITGCMARYGDKNLDNFLKCTIEDNECIKVAIIDGGADAFGDEPRAPAPTVRNFDPRSLEGSWFKVCGVLESLTLNFRLSRSHFTMPAFSSLGRRL